MTDEGNEALFKEAVWLLRVIAAPMLRELEERFDAALLTSDKRYGMWAAMNGTNTLAGIASDVGVTRWAVRLFLKEVEESFPQLIEISDSPCGKMPERRIGIG